jgi:hypothetical protein
MLFTKNNREKDGISERKERSRKPALVLPCPVHVSYEFPSL